MNPILEFIIVFIVITFIVFIIEWLKPKKIKRKHISKELKRKIFKKYNKACAICPSRSCLEIHHRDNRPDNNDEENLILLCHSCHLKTRKKI